MAYDPELEKIPSHTAQSVEASQMALNYRLSPKPIPADVLKVLGDIGHGAVALFATTYRADELKEEHDEDSRGECTIARELLIEEKTMFGDSRSWFDSGSFLQLASSGRAYDVVAVLDAMDNFDISAQLCYQECGEADCDGGAWESFTEWRDETAQRSRLSVLLLRLHMVLALKLHVIRFRKRVHAPGGALCAHAAKRFRALAQ